MKVKYLVVLIFLAAQAKAQWFWDVGGTIGASNYLGDIGGKAKSRQNFIGDLRLAQTRWNAGGFIRLKWRPAVSWKLAADYIRLQGNDKLSTNPGRKYRNFNFRNDIIDLGFTAEISLYENADLGRTYRYRNALKIYAFAGAGVFTNNPKTLYQGSWVALRPYATEGVHYKKFVMNIPMGIGAYITINKRNRFGVEIDYRKTFTDYIDDISGNYPAAAPASEFEQGLVLRTTELDIGDNPPAYYSHTWGAKRGDNKHKDSYATLNLTYSRVLRGNPSFYRGRKGGFFRSKTKGRKIRTRF